MNETLVGATGDLIEDAVLLRLPHGQMELALPDSLRA
jgi:hypothetical protein